jgi:hypothetical protein
MMAEGYRPMSDNVYKGRTCGHSYWVGADRGQLAQRVAERKHQQALPGEAELKFDPAVAASASLFLDHRKGLPRTAAAAMGRRR